MTFGAILALCLLLHVAPTNCQGPRRDQKFRDAIEFWTEAICTVPSAKTIHFHGIFADCSNTARHFFEILLRSIGEYCDAIILSKTYVSPNYQNSTTTKNELETSYESIDDNNQTAWKLVSTERSTIEWKHAKNSDHENQEFRVDLWNINVIVFEDAGSLEDLLSLTTPFEWTKREHFIALALWDDVLGKLNTKALVREILEGFWKRFKIQNVLFNEPLVDTPQIVYTYNPFVKINATSWGKLEFVKAKSKRHMFHLLSTLTYRRTRDMNGYSLNVGLFEQYESLTKIKGTIPPDSIFVYSGGYNGTDGIVLGTVSKKMNFKANIVLPLDDQKFGHELENGTYTGALADVVYRRVDVCFVAFFVKKYGRDTGLMEFTSYVSYDSVCVVVPKAYKIPKGFRLYYIFDSTVWLFSLLAQLFTHITWYFIQMLTPRRVEKVNFQTTLFQAFLVNSGYPLKLPSSNAERILLTGVFVSSITITGTFNGALYKAFARDMYYKDIDRMDELDESGLPIVFSSLGMADIFGPKNDPDTPPLLKRLGSKLIFGHNTMRHAAIYRNISGILRGDTYPLLRETYVDKDGSHLLHLTKECPGHYYLAYLLPKHSILLQRFNDLIGRLNQAGLLGLWKSRTILARAIKSRINLRKKHGRGKNGFVPFNLSDVQTSFYVLLIGLLLSTIVFLEEKGWLSRCYKKIVTKGIDCNAFSLL